MRVEPRRRRTGAGLAKTGREPAATRERTGFAAALREAAAIQTASERERLLTAVDTAAAALKLNPGSEALWQYREAVRAFVGAAIQAMYTVEEARKFDRRGRQSLWVLVRTIDAALEALTRAVLAEQADFLAIAARTDEIRGLLIDLYH